MSKYRKAISAFLIGLVGAMGTWVPVALNDGRISTGEWWALLGALLTVIGATFGVYQVPNAPPTP